MVTRKCDRKIPTVSVKSNYNVEGNFKIDGSLIVNGKDISALKNTTLNGVSGDIVLEAGNGINIEKNGKTITISSSFDEVNVLKYVYCDTKPSVENATRNTIYIIEKPLNFEAWMLSSDGEELKNLTSAFQGESGEVGEEIYKVIEEKFLLIDKDINDIKQRLEEIDHGDIPNFKIVETIEEIEKDANENIIYFLKKEDKSFEEYIYVDGKPEIIKGGTGGNCDCDDSKFVTHEYLEQNYVSKENVDEVIASNSDVSQIKSSVDDLTSIIEGENGIENRLTATENQISEIEEVVTNIDDIIDEKIKDIKSVSFKSVDSLESIVNPETNVIYLVPTKSVSNDNLKDEYIYIGDDENGKAKFELIGTSSVDLSGYVTSDDLNNYATTDYIQNNYVENSDLTAEVTNILDDTDFLRRAASGYMTLDDLIVAELEENTIYWVRDKSSIEQYIKKEGKLMQISGNLNVKITETFGRDKWELPWNENETEIYDNLPEMVDGSYLFQNYKNLTTFVGDMSNMKNAIDMFKGCNNLSTFNGELFSLKKAKGMFEGCKLSSESIENILYTLESGLATGEEGEFEITIGYDSSDEEINDAKIDEWTSDAEDKGWNIIWIPN